MPKSSVGKEALFGSESGLKSYTYSFYDMLPTGSELNQIEIELVDFVVQLILLPDFLVKNAYSETISGGWSWSNLRNINYFIVNCTNEAVNETVRIIISGWPVFLEHIFITIRLDVLAMFLD